MLVAAPPQAETIVDIPTGSPENLLPADDEELFRDMIASIWEENPSNPQFINLTNLRHDQAMIQGQAYGDTLLLEKFDEADDYPEPDEEMTATSGLLDIPNQVQARLSYLLSLPTNWDHEESRQVPQTTNDRAQWFLEKAFAEARGQLPSPFIGAAFDGMLVIEWTTESGKELIADIPALPDEPIGFLLVEPDLSGREYELDSVIGDTWSPEQLIRRLLDN